MVNLKNSNNLHLWFFWLPIVLIFILLPLGAEAKIFDPVSTDKSVEYLGMIFGHKIGGLSLGQESNASQFLNNLFQMFNGVILAVAMFILSYVSIISTVNTAQEGQVMGKKWSSIWIPLRSTIGLLLLAPVPGSGYSSLQVVIMWIVLNGIGAADQMWSFVLNNLSQGISATQKDEINRKDVIKLSKQGTVLAKNLFDSLVCVAIINNNMDPPRGNHIAKKLNYYFPKFTPNPITEPVSIKFGIEEEPSNNIRSSICGELKISASFSDEDLIDPNNTKVQLNDNQKARIIDFAYRTKIGIINHMISQINHVAETIGTTKRQKDGSVILNDIYPPGYLYKAIIDYQKSISALTKQVAMSQVGIPILADKQAISDSVINQGKAFGWITAGSYYYLLTQGSLQNLLTTATQEITLTSKPIHSEDETSIRTKLDQATLEGVTGARITPYKKALNNSQSIANLFNPSGELALNENLQFKTKTASKFNLSGDHESEDLGSMMQNKFIPDINKLLENTNNKKLVELISPYIKQFSNLNEIVLKDIQHCLSDQHDDPLLSQAIFGVELMQLSENFWIGIIMSSFVSSAIASSLAGSGVSTLITLLPPILIFAGIIWVIGASFAIYMPMLPYMMFIVTALGWFILVIEAIVAAPVVALGFIMPSQDELGKIAPALGIIANVFLRPVLMVVGLIMAAKLYNTIISMVNMGFKFSFAALQSQTGTTMFAWIVMLILYSGFIVTLVNKCYALIYQLPDKVLRWIGVSGEQTDVSSIKETQQSFDQGSKQGMAPMEGTASAAANKLKQNVAAATKKDGSGYNRDN